MALNGTLEELAVLDVVQFVNQAHLSGTLVLKSASHEAELFYRKGGLVHARLGEVSGLEVLVRIVDWTSGTFAFGAGTPPSEETIRMDLHRAVMYALKTRDERKQDGDKARQAVEPRNISFQEQFTEMVAPLEFVRQAAIFDGSGVLASVGRGNKSGDDLAPLCTMLMAFSAGYVRGRFRRAILDDEKGMLLVSGLHGNRWIVIVAERGVALGAATVGMGSLIAKIETLGAHKQDGVREALAGAI